VAEGARLESVFGGNSNVGSNPTLSARLLSFVLLTVSARPFILQLWCTLPPRRSQSAMVAFHIGGMGDRQDVQKKYVQKNTCGKISHCVEESGKTYAQHAWKFS
jgi:hypothetical protein